MPIPKTGYKIGRFGQHKPHHYRSKFVLPILTIFSLLIIFGFITVVIFSRDLPDPNRLIDRDIPSSTKIYDRTGEVLLYEIHGDQKRTLVRIEEIPNYVKNAAITVEDRDFYKHKGYDLSGILRALIIDIFTGSPRQGGSTITQQFIKNAILDRKKSIIRKAKELVLAYRLEQKFTKDEILQFYFNEIPYGSTLYGIESASQAFFGKSVKDLSLAQAAIVAAIPKAPTYYSPYGNHPDELLERKNFVLKEMAKLGYITEIEAQKAMNEEIEFRPKREQMLAPHFVTYVKEILSESYGETAVEQGGLKVITTLDSRLQKFAEDAISQNENRLLGLGASNASLVAIDPKTGEVLAMVGSKDYFNEEIDGNVNVALRPRQPGSSFKPIVYSAAFISGFTPDTVLYDVVTTHKTETGKLYTPHNYDNKEHGPVTMRQALAGSLNIPAVKTIYLTGINKVLDLAQNMGYTTLEDRSRFGLSLVLGGGEVKLIEHTRAFSAFANDGNLAQTKAVLKVEDLSGDVLEENNDNELEEVLPAQIARQINNILSDNKARAFIFGEKNYLTLPGRPVAAKTGTTNDFRDAWTVGYTPSLAAGVWVGNNDNTPMKSRADGSAIAAPIWNYFMRNALAGKPAEAFAPPPESEKNDDPGFSNTAGKIKVRIDKLSGKLATDLTPKNLIEEKTYFSPHSLLYYVNPTDPAVKSWEEAIQKWVKKNKLSIDTPPTESDDLHTEQNLPEASFISPQSDQKMTSPQITISIDAKALRGISRVNIFFDDALIAELLNSPYIYNFSIPSDISNGTHKISAAITDDVDNSTYIYRGIYLER